jgi:hypothetical protein
MHRIELKLGARVLLGLCGLLLAGACAGQSPTGVDDGAAQTTAGASLATTGCHTTLVTPGPRLYRDITASAAGRSEPSGASTTQGTVVCAQ